MYVDNSTMDPSRCVVIELELAGEERILNYLSARKGDYNWILKESDEDLSKVKVCVWWREDKEFFNTPLRSFLKRLKNKRVFDHHTPDGSGSFKSIYEPKISGKMSTEEGVQLVCKRVPGSITKYHLEMPLYPCLSGLLPCAPPYSIEDSNEVPPPVEDSKEVDESEPSGGESILGNILQKLNQIHEVIDGIADMRNQINRLREAMSSLHGVYSDYDPPRSYPDPVIQATRDLIESSLSCLPPIDQSQGKD